MVHDDDQFKITVWAHSWSEIINDARTRLNFINQQLAYEVGQDSAKEYLNKTHAKFIPEPEPSPEITDEVVEEKSSMAS